MQVFQSAILEAKRYKAGGGDALSEMLDILADSVIYYALVNISCLMCFVL